MGVSFEDVLDELGWKDGFRIPVANEENKRLEIEVRIPRKKRFFFLFRINFKKLQKNKHSKKCWPTSQCFRIVIQIPTDVTLK